MDIVIIKQTDGVYVEIKKDLLSLNGDNNGGLIIEKNIVDELNKVNGVLQSMMSIIQGAPILEPGNGAPSALQISLSASLAGKQLPNYTDITNKKVTHGE